MPTPLILLKTKNIPTDPYETYFTSHPFTPTNGGGPVPFEPIYVPVLQHRHINLSALEELIISNRILSSPEPNPLPTSEKKVIYGGLIITSQRAVEALGSILSKLSSQPEQSKTLSTLLAQTIAYVVGSATSAAVVALGFNPSNVLGEHCGNGAALAQFILSDYNPRYSSPPDKKPLLFLVGEIHRDVIPTTLRTAPENEKIAVMELVIYETAVVSGFRDEFREVMRRTEGKREDARWVVVFSPTGADVALEVLREEGKDTRVAVIGPTTEVFLRGLGREPEVVAGRPNPEGLWEVVEGFMAKNK